MKYNVMIVDAHKLDDIAILKGLSGEPLRHLTSECRWRTVARGGVILDSEMQSTDVYLLAVGRVRVTIYSPSGREVALRDLGAGESFGELAAIDGSARSASVVALEDSIIAALSREQFWNLLQGQAVVAGNVLKRLAALIRDLTARVVDTTTLTVPERVRAEIVRLARAAGVKGNRSTIKGLPTHADLASRLGATREAVSRELARMADAGLIARQGRDLVVADFEALLEATADSA